MNTILLVDDDDYVIEGLLRHIPWAEMNVQVAGTASDGIEGLARYRELRPDFVITDIYMPGMDGFQLTEAIRELDPDVPVVFLSGYDDLANARKAVSNGVHHFLLKPPGLTEIDFVVREVVQKLNETRERDELLAQYLQQQAVVQRSMKDTFFRNLLATRYRPDELPQERIAFMSLPVRPSVQALAISLVRSSDTARRDEREWQLLRFGTGNVIRETIAAELGGESGLSAEMVEVSDQEFVVIFLADGTDEQARERLAAAAEKASALTAANILQYMKLSVLAGLGTVRSGYAGLIDSYLESKRAVEIAEMNEWNRVYVYSAEVEAEREAAVSMEAVRELHDAIFSKKWQRAAELWGTVARDLSGAGTPLPVCKGICSGIVSAVWTAGQTFGGIDDGEAAAASTPGLEEQLLRLNRFGSNRQLVDWMEGLFGRLMAGMREEAGGRRSHALVDKVIKDYIEKCYHEPLSLEGIAVRLHVNRNYLSQLFKRVTGEPFVTFLNKYRIRKAIELIVTGKYLVYEISEKVGFQNSTYFSQVFKSITGCSPSEYNR